MRTVTDSCRQGNPRRAGSMSATPGAHGHGGAAMACAPAFICLPCSWRIGQLWCPACLQVTLRCSQTSLGSLTSGVLEMVPFCSLPKCRNPLCLWLFSPGAPGHQGRGKSPAAYTCCLQGPPHTTKRGLWWDQVRDQVKFAPESECALVLGRGYPLFPGSCVTSHTVQDI